MAEQCSNPLLARWLKEWMDQAKERNSKGFTVYKKAYQSIIACPARFQHPSEAQQLNGIGPKLCDRLTDKMKVFCDENGIPMPSKGGKRKRSSEATDESLAEAEQPSPVRKTRVVKQYVPKLRSGGYALIMALSTLNQDANEAIPKERLIDLAQPLCDSNFKVPSDPTKFFTAWNTMKTLEAKELVGTKGHPVKKYYLSDEGWEVALRMRAAENGDTGLPPAAKSKQRGSALDLASKALPPEIAVRRPPDATFLASTQASRSTYTTSGIVELLSDSDGDPFASEETSNNSRSQSSYPKPRPARSSSSSDDTIILPIGSFEVKMVLDMREVRTKTDRDYISGELKNLGITPIIRSLPLGDILWVAAVNPMYTETLRAANIADNEDGNLEIVLEHIMERKRLDDLISSIKDGRFHEQKFRLQKSGIKHVTYLIEEYSLSAERSDKYGEALESAIAGMQVVNGHFVKQTAKLDDTIQYLARMTKILKSHYARKEVHVIPCNAFEAEGVAIAMDRFRKDSPETIFGMTFSLFGAMCDKSESMTLRDVFLKMLMCVRSLTGEKAVEIQKIWHTPRAFTEAYASLEPGIARDNMVSDRLGNAIPRKKIAKGLSAKIAEVWA